VPSGFQFSMDEFGVKLYLIRVIVIVSQFKEKSQKSADFI
jgi:hypothetical protein